MIESKIHGNPFHFDELGIEVKTDPDLRPKA